MKKIVFVLIIVIFTISCEKENRPIDTFEIEYSIESSWVGYKYSTVILSNGFLNVTEVHDLNSYNRENTFNIDINEIELIKERFKPLTEVNLKPTYGFGANKPTDLPVTKLLYKTNFNTDSTFIYHPEENELPNALDLFLITVRQIINENDTLQGQ